MTSAEPTTAISIVDRHTDGVSEQGPASRATIPRSAAVRRAFTTSPDSHHVLVAASRLADQHRARAEARTVATDRLADDHAVAAATRSVNAAEAACTVLIDHVDAWAASALTGLRTGSMNTESLGQVIDRLAAAWVRWRFSEAIDDETRGQAQIALHNFAELSNAYDDLVSDVEAGRRRLPHCQLDTVVAA